MRMREHVACDIDVDQQNNHPPSASSAFNDFFPPLLFVRQHSGESPANSSGEGDNGRRKDRTERNSPPRLRFCPREQKQRKPPVLNWATSDRTGSIKKSAKARRRKMGGQMGWDEHRREEEREGRKTEIHIPLPSESRRSSGEAQKRSATLRSWQKQANVGRAWLMWRPSQARHPLAVRDFCETPQMCKGIFSSGGTRPLLENPARFENDSPAKENDTTSGYQQRPVNNSTDNQKKNSEQQQAVQTRKNHPARRKSNHHHHHHIQDQTTHHRLMKAFGVAFSQHFVRYFFPCNLSSFFASPGQAP